MNPWVLFAKTFVYPIARAWADAWFDAQRLSQTYQEEKPNDADKERAARFRAAVDGVRVPAKTDTGPQYSPQNIPPDNGVDSITTTERKSGGN